MSFSDLICSKNGKKSRKQRILECFTVCDGSCASIKYFTGFQLNEAFVSFDRKTRSMLLMKQLKTNIP